MKSNGAEITLKTVSYLLAAQLHQMGKLCALFLPFHACHAPERQGNKLGAEKYAHDLAQSYLCSLLSSTSQADETNKHIEIVIRQSSCLAERSY